MVSGENLSRSQMVYDKAIYRFFARVEQSFGQLKKQFHALHNGLSYVYRITNDFDKCANLKFSGTALSVRAH
ncbi:hypothetical protein Y032_0693g1585 [Ancylostoma ceylanicum]|uniref:Uncharacterized protein n=1 Tax=Ancylostoma ceylanicum TaxID=53326 RepID=A0A016WGN9_9BILA|nr:hypothetical protein Y032_0693g1585 [Ancylostoma ceylanicum]